jgi:FMN phosphatase YigB (HAD superfamily)
MIEAVAFDLFETLVRVDWDRLPNIHLGGQPRPSTAPYLLDLVTEHLPGLGAVELAEHMLENWREARALAATLEHVEVPAQQRFSRLVERLGIDDPHLRVPLATALKERHQRVIESSVSVPDAERSLLDWCSERFPLALVSNFDDGPCARRILEQQDLIGAFQAIVISEELGLRKPRVELFGQALQDLGDPPPDRVPFVGDDPRADVQGARGAGMPAIWLCRDRRLEPPDPPPAFIAHSAVDVLTWLRRQGGGA